MRRGAAGLACGRGVQVDDGLATSDPDIFAIGECAEHRGICYGVVAPAYEQARVLARRVTRQNPDAAFFAGIVHEVGSFYLISRAADFPGLLRKIRRDRCFRIDRNQIGRRKLPCFL